MLHEVASTGLYVYKSAFIGTGQEIGPYVVTSIAKLKFRSTDRELETIQSSKNHTLHSLLPCLLTMLYYNQLLKLPYQNALPLHFTSFPILSPLPSPLLFPPSILV